jgi:hypothetical protein
VERGEGRVREGKKFGREGEGRDRKRRLMLNYLGFKLFGGEGDF